MLQVLLNVDNRQSTGRLSFYAVYEVSIVSWRGSHFLLLTSPLFVFASAA